MTPQSVGRYQIIGELGKGAMGVVYKATDPNIGRTVALKTMRLDIHGMEAEEMLQRFRAEAHAAGVLSHPNLVTIYDAGEHDQHFYIAMECVEGDTLQKLILKHKTLPLDRVISITRQICAGLDYAHSHGVIHRDVKPANIMVAPDGTVKIMDFGIAKAGGGGLTSTGQVMGSPTYMSPEQVKGHPIDGRSDLFSVGTLLYEMVTGEKAFAAQNVTTIIYKIVSEEPKPPKDVHPGLALVIAKALAKKREQRFQKGVELAHALENYKRVVPSAPTPVAVSKPATAPVSSTKTAAAAPAPAKAAIPPEPAAPKPAAAVPPSRDTVPIAAPRDASGSQPVHTPAAALPIPKPALIAGGAVLLLAILAGAVMLTRKSEAPAPEPVAAAESPQPTPPSAAEPLAIPAETAAAESAPTEPAEAAPAPPAPAPRRVAPTPPRTATPAATAPAPTVPAARSGDLLITSSPSGAKVQIDGWSEAAWVTPMRTPQLSSGRHTIAVSKAGFGTETRTVEVAGGRTGSQNFELKAGATSPPPATPSAPTSSSAAPAAQPSSSKSPFGKIKGLFGGGIPEGKGMLEVKTKPKGASVTLNGRPTAQTTPFKLALDPGPHTISIGMTGYKTVRRSFTIEKGKSLEIEQPLEKQ